MTLAVEFDAELIRRYDLNGPRYTSYPTAVQFSEAFGVGDYRRCIAASNEDPIPRPLSLYVHVPFCASPCFYCACTRVITRDRGKAGQYLDYLFREIEMQAALFPPDREVQQLHFGGGTPTFLSPDQLHGLMDRLGGAFRFAPPGNREFSIEIDPRTVGPKDVFSLHEMGFNRMSLGVQDFDPAVQAAVNRIQPERDTLAVLEAARAAGVGGVNLDLIYGLPKQTAASFTRTLDRVIAARPERLAVYSYAHLPQVFKAQRQLDAEELPSGETKLRLLQLTIERLTAAGYVYIGMDHFAVPEDELVRALEQGSLQRNFQGYSTHAECDMIGLGMSAIGAVGDCYAQNYKTIPQYYAALDAGRLPLWRGVALSGEDRLRREVIRTLMCEGRLDYRVLGERLNIDFRRHFARELAALVPLAMDGLVRLTPDGLQLTGSGRLLMRAVAMVFDAYQPGRRSGSYSRVI